MIGVKLLLKDGHFITTKAPPEEATRLIREWQNNREKTDFYLGGQDILEGQVWVWNVPSCNVIAIHTMILPQEERVHPGRFSPGTSGLQI